MSANSLLNINQDQISGSFDAVVGGSTPSTEKAYSVGTSTSAVTQSYGDIIQEIYSLTQQSTNASSLTQAESAIQLVQIMSQLRQSAETGTDFINGSGTNPFLMSDDMVQTMDLLSIQMASNNLTPSQILNWAVSAGIPINSLGSKTIPTDYTDIQNALSMVLSTLASLQQSGGSLPSSSSSTVFSPDLSFSSWQNAMSSSDNQSLLVAQIQSTLPTLSIPVDNGYPAGSTNGSGQSIAGSSTVYKYATDDINASVVSTFNGIIANLNTIAQKSTTGSNALTQTDVNTVIQDMNALRTLAQGVQVVDPNSGLEQIAYLTSPMLQAIDSLSKGLASVGLNTSSTTASNPNGLADLQAWVTPPSSSSSNNSSSGGSNSNTSIAETSIQLAQSAGATTGSIQSMIEVQYINAGTTLLNNQLESLNQALVSVQNTAQLLGTLQQIQNYVNVNAPNPIALQAYQQDAASQIPGYISSVQTAIFNTMTPADQQQIEALYGLNQNSFVASQINLPIFTGISLLQDNGTSLIQPNGSSVSGSISISQAFNTYKTAFNTYTTNYENNQITFSQYGVDVVAAQRTLINALSNLAYVTLPQANLNSATPVASPSQINALRQLINPFLVGGTADPNPNNPLPQGFLIPNPANAGPNPAQLPTLTNSYVYSLGEAAETTPPSMSYFNGPTISSPNHYNGSFSIVDYFNDVDSSISSLQSYLTVDFNSNLTSYTSSNQNSTSVQSTPENLQDPASYGIIGNLGWNASDTDLGTVLNSAAGGPLDSSGNNSLISTNAQNINNAFTLFYSRVNSFNYIDASNDNYVSTDLGNSLINIVNTLTSQGALTTDQQISLTTSISNSVTTLTQTLIKYPVGSTTPPPAYQDAISQAHVLQAYLTQSYASTPSAIGINGLLSERMNITPPSAPQALSSSTLAALGVPTIPDFNLQSAIVTAYNNLTVAQRKTFVSQLAASNVTADSLSQNSLISTTEGASQQLSTLTLAYTNLSPSQQNEVINALNQDTNSGIPGSGPVTINGNSPYPVTDPSVINVLNIYNGQSLASLQINFYSAITSNTAYANTSSVNQFQFQNVIQFLQGPNNSYPAISVPINTSSYVPIPAQQFATFYNSPSSSIVKTVQGYNPILTANQMTQGDPANQLSLTNFQTLTQQLYGSSIPAFVNLPAGQTMSSVLATIQSTRAQLAEQISGLQQAQQQQAKATGSASAVVPIVQYVSTVLSDLSSIPDPTSSNYNAADAQSALAYWILDGMQLNQNSANPATTSAAANTGQYANNLQTAITAATNMNGTQQQTFQQYMTIYSEFMQSASAMLTALMQVYQAMATGIKG